MNNNTNLNSGSHKRAKQSFSKQEVELNIKAASFVKITPQAKAKLDKIPNRIGPYECKLCKVIYNSAFDLASHNCPYIFHCEYKCSECGKVFNSPANLASHKRWHRPRPKPKLITSTSSTNPELTRSNGSNSCTSNNSNQMLLSNPLHIHTNYENHNSYSSDLTSPLPSVSNEWLSHFYVNYFQAAAAAQNLFVTYNTTPTETGGGSIYQDFLSQYNQNQ